MICIYLNIETNKFTISIFSCSSIIPTCYLQPAHNSALCKINQVLLFIRANIYL